MQLSILRKLNTKYKKGKYTENNTVAIASLHEPTQLASN